MSFLNKIFKDSSKKYFDKAQPLVEQINNLEEKFKAFSDEDLKNKTKEFKERLKKGETLDDLLVEAFAVVREASKRTLNQRHYDSQLVAGMVLKDSPVHHHKHTYCSALPLK